MPYTIHIPAPYQMRNHILTTLHATTIPRIDISSAAPVSIAIYNDTQAWGWNVSYTPLSTYGPAKWDAYRRLAHQNGWFNHLWLIWQHEHWLRIKAKDKLMRTATLGPVRGAFREVRGWGRWVRKPGLGERFGKWKMVERTIEGVQRVRAATYRRGGRLRRTASEGDLARVGVEVEVEVESLTGSLVERLDAFRLKEKDGGVETMGDEEEAAEDKKPGSESQSPFSDEYALPTKEWYE